MFQKSFVSVIKCPLSLLIALLMMFTLIGCTSEDMGILLDGLDGIMSSDPAENTASAAKDDAYAPSTEAAADTVSENGSYYSRDDVALYIHTYGHLPNNFITKDEAEELGWEGGSVDRYLEGAAIGGDQFGNREGLLPKANGRIYYECDIDTNGKSSRGAKRIVYSNDGLIYYSDDHYESFTLLYGEE